MPRADVSYVLCRRVGEEVAQEHHSYVRLPNDEGHTIPQSYHRPGQQYYPSSLCQPGGMVLDGHVLWLPGNQHDAFTVVAGAYEYPAPVPL